MPPRLQLPSTSSHTASCARARCFSSSSQRPAQLIRRPHRPYHFTQLLTLSDGSTALHRTTSPLPVYRSNKDTRNSPLWNPSNEKMANVEEDEAGRLRAFRRRFGRGWDARSGAGEETLSEAVAPPTDAEAGGAPGASVRPTKPVPGGDAAASKATATSDKADNEWSADDEDNLMDLISAAGLAGPQHKGPVATAQKTKAAGKGGKKK